MGFQITLTASDPAATGIVLTDGATLGKWGVDEWTPGESAWDVQFGGERGNLGALPTSMTPQNRTVRLGLSCWPTNLQDAATLRADLGAVLHAIHTWGGRLTYQHTGQTFRQNLRVLAGTAVTGAWTPRSELDGRHGVAVQLTCAPHVEGDPMGFRTDLADGYTGWTPDATTNLTVTAAGLVGGASGAWNFLNATPGYEYRDVQMTARFTPVLSGTPQVRLRLKETATHRLWATVIDSGSATQLQVNVEEIGVVSATRHTASVTRMANAGQCVLVARTEGDLVTIDWWVGRAQDPHGTPDDTTSYRLTGGDEDDVGQDISGVVGFSMGRTSGAITLHDVTVTPAVQAGVAGDRLPVRGVPGDVPAAVDLDVHVDPSSGGASGSQLRFGLIATAPAPTRVLVTDGGFGLATTPEHWADSSYSGLLTSGKATLTRETTVSRSGQASGKVVTTGSGEGVTHVIHHQFVEGRVYTVSVWVRATGSPTLRVRLGVNGDIASSSAPTAGTGWAQLTATWTPSATVHAAYLVVEQTSAGAGTWWVDDASVVEGATAADHGSGWGGHPCDGALDAVDTIDTGGTIHNAGAGATFLHDKKLAWTTTTSGSASYLLDTSRLHPDDLGGSVMVEAWLKASVPTGVETTITAFIAGANETNPDHYTYPLEHGDAGVTVTPGSPNGFHLFRLGTFPLMVSQDPTVLTVTQTYGSSQSWAWAHLVLVPAAARACSPTGLADLTGYPVFAATTDVLGASRRFTSDMQGWRRLPGTDAWSPAPPLDGPVLELEPGDNHLVVVTAGNAPNSAASHGSSETARAVVIEPNITPRWRHLRDQ